MPLWRCFVEVILVQNKVMLIEYRWLSQIICVGHGQSKDLNRVETSLEKKVHPWTKVSTHLQESLGCPPWGMPCRFWTLVTNPYKCTSQFLKHISKSVFLQLALIHYLFPDWCSHKTHEVSPRLVCPQLLEPQPPSSSSLQHIKEQAAICCYQACCLFKCLFHEPSQDHQAGFHLHKTTVFDHYENHPCLSSSITFGPRHGCHPLALECRAKGRTSGTSSRFNVGPHFHHVTQPKPQTSRHMLLPLQRPKAWGFLSFQGP